MSETGEPAPESPAAEQVDAPPARVVEAVEPLHLIANEARPRLRDDGFTDDQIDDWARAFYAERGEGTADELIEWIKAREQHR